MDKKMAAEFKKVQYSDSKIRRNKRSIAPPARGGIKRRIFALFYAQLKLAAQHIVVVIFSQTTGSHSYQA
ncbi:hypothetical protein OWV82_024154 [Melia azedarach]|uniref:Uncharacterized protein n=1 Tax=Melia azedarach TaxID=155640 RepID=A0ACC1WPH1_MELAZ|nr:hypothetical protein OWV82_024154 [Melia azedarach]